MVKMLKTLILVCIIFEPLCLQILGDSVSWTNYRNTNNKLLNYYYSDPIYKWETEWLLDVPIDNFSFGNADTFRLRYLINLDNYVNGGPILFLTGSEDSIEKYAQMTGFVWDSAPEFRAAVVFAEHRYYGESWPYPKELCLNNISYLGYLSSEQALADFASLIDHLKQKRIPGAENSPVIAIGGSYGGMLSAYMRIKYPHLVQGAIASSAPVYGFIDSSPRPITYDKVIMNTFLSEGCNYGAIRNSIASLRNLSRTEDGRNYLSDLFYPTRKYQLRNPDDANKIMKFLYVIFFNLAQSNYPYGVQFSGPLSVWPVAAACKHLSNVAKDDKEAVRNLKIVFDLYHSHLKNNLYNNPQKASTLFSEADVWTYQTCTEILFPTCSTGSDHEFFGVNCPLTLKNKFHFCKHKFGLKDSQMRPHWITRNYGKTSFPTATNIIFSNGKFDPWSVGSYSFDEDRQGPLFSLILKRGAHHYDLRGAHPRDTVEVKEVRDFERQQIRNWIYEHSRSLWKQG